MCNALRVVVMLMMLDAEDHEEEQCSRRREKQDMRSSEVSKVGKDPYFASCSQDPGFIGLKICNTKIEIEIMQQPG